jgi:tRNA(Arg) A34 adenosine deaminase TadA
MEEKHTYFMQRAIVLAKKGKTNGGGAFGAVVVQEDTIVAYAHNSVKSAQDCTQHAELAVIQKACGVLENKDLSDCILYTSCEPCMMCLGACYWAKFKAIYFGASAQDAKENGYVYSDMFYASDRNKRHEEFNMHQLLRDEAVAVWSEDD